MSERDIEKDAPTFTDRQAKAWQDDVAPILERHGIAGLPSYWNLHWSEETRPGRGHYLNATYVDGEVFAQVLMDVYGDPSVSVAELDWIHADSDEELACDTCARPEVGCCQTCDVAAQGIPVPCDPDGEPIHGPYADMHSGHTQGCEDWRKATPGRPCVCRVAAEVPDDY